MHQQVKKLKVKVTILTYASPLPTQNSPPSYYHHPKAQWTCPLGNYDQVFIHLFEIKSSEKKYGWKSYFDLLSFLWPAPCILMIFQESTNNVNFLTVILWNCFKQKLNMMLLIILFIALPIVTLSVMGKREIL